MSTYELHIYTLKDTESFNYYNDEIYPKHLGSFAVLDITPHGFWTVPGSNDNKLYIFGSYPDGADVDTIDQAYRQSPGFLEDVETFDLSNIVDVESMRLEPSTGSPLT